MADPIRPSDLRDGRNMIDDVFTLLPKLSPPRHPRLIGLQWGEAPHYEIAATSCSNQITVFELFEGFHLFHLHPFRSLCVLIILGFKGLKAQIKADLYLGDEVLFHLTTNFANVKVELN